MWFLILLRFGFWRVNQLVNLVMLKFHAGCCSYILRWNMKIYVDSRQSCGKFTGILILTPGLNIINYTSCWTLPRSFKRQQGSCKVRFWPKVFTNFDFQASFLSLENNKNVLICWPVTQIRVYRGNFTKMCPSTPHQTERTNKCRLNLSYLSWRLEIKGNQWHHWKAQTLFKSVLHDWKLAKEELEDENRYEMYTAGRVQLWPFPGGILLPKFQ